MFAAALFPFARHESEPMKNLLKRFLRERSGATAIEYGLIAALVSIAMAGTMMPLKEKVLGLYKAVSEAVPVDVTPPSP